ncbi:asparagine synthase (glutamine-hydrolyzing) [Pedobacter sp. Leaf132]|uniref:asparagine synthase (glutamine-hydrolyzing) n=1 Tax=Pedobacter sp. Leaf132 TaxID=2876557 RepID=UPI001E5BFFED|nr:asparagine synthase (glutamine-hydrolyzing) [Pedobacter sp. Leaf132]
MCRIAGIIDKTKTEAQLVANVKAMCDAMAHGGPDDEGFYIEALHGIAFGHRRLALIDLSAAGHQPMFYNENRLVLSFNGEIYNYRELKAELLNLSYEFNSNSDTEVILAAYAEWGIKSFDKLKGMFAFSIFDTIQNVTYLVRDSSGIKPLYYSTINQNLVFASEVKAFKQTDYKYTNNKDWKIYFLAFGHIPEPYTTHTEIQMLPKANYMAWWHATNSFEIHSYSHVADENRINNYAEALEKVKKGLQHSVKRHLYADAAIGTFLSGGIDSSIISIVANQVIKNPSNLHTLSINFDETEYSEKAFQDLISKQINSNHKEDNINKTCFEKYFPHAMAAIDQPTTDGINSWFISYFARQNGLKAVLSGIGADELFGGYPSFKRMDLVEKLSKLPRFILKQGLRFNSQILKRAYYLSYKNTSGKYLFLRGFFNPQEIASILNLSVDEVDEVLKTANVGVMKSSLTAKQKASWLEYNLYMQNQLLKDTDAMSMQHGVEVRVPFLDKDLVQIVKEIKSDLVYETKKPKGLLVDAFKNVLPEKIWNRPKMGFTFPFENWLSTNEQFLSKFSGRGNKNVNAFIEDFKKGKLHWSKMIALYQVVD